MKLFILFIFTSFVFASDFVVGETPDYAILLNVKQQLLKIDKQNKSTSTSNLMAQLSRQKCNLNLPNLKTKKLSLSELYRQNKPSVVMLCSLFKCSYCTNWHVSVASGFFISSNGVLVTSYHVISKKDNMAFAAVTEDGKILPITEVLAADKYSDIAILKVKGNNFKPLPINPNLPLVGQQIVTIHNPAKNLFMFTAGIINKIKIRKLKPTKVLFYQISADFAGGSSGAPVMDLCGNVLSIVCSTFSIEGLASTGKTQAPHQMTIHNTATANDILNLID